MDYITIIEEELTDLRAENMHLRDKLEIYEQELFLLRENKRLTSLVVPSTLTQGELDLPF